MLNCDFIFIFQESIHIIYEFSPHQFSTQNQETVFKKHTERKSIFDKFKETSMRKKLVKIGLNENYYTFESLKVLQTFAKLILK